MHCVEKFSNGIELYSTVYMKSVHVKSITEMRMMEREAEREEESLEWDVFVPVHFQYLFLKGFLLLLNNFHYLFFHTCI